MSSIEQYLEQLDAALRARGAQRRRFVRECRDHLVDAASEVGEEGAVRAFGAPAEIAAAFDAEVAARRGVRATALSVVGVLATGASTLAVVHGAAPDATAPGALAVVFFVGAQLAAVAAGSALLQALVVRRSTAEPGALMLLARRNWWALGTAGMTMFVAGAALPGHGSPVLLLAGPALVAVAVGSLLYARVLTRRLGPSAGLVARSPLEDLATLCRVRLPSIPDGLQLAAVTGAAITSAFLWAHGEHEPLLDAFRTAGIEGTAVVAGFLALGPRLGLRGRRTGP